MSGKTIKSNQSLANIDREKVNFIADDATYIPGPHATRTTLRKLFGMKFSDTLESTLLVRRTKEQS